MKLSVWTGPTLVQHAAGKLREAGLTVLVEGTERVHLLAPNAETVVNVLNAPDHRGWKLRDVQTLGSE